MHTFAPAVVVFAALMWPAAGQAQSLGEVAQREAARRQAEAAAPKTAPSTAALPAQAQPGTAVEDSSTATISLAEVARREAARRKALAAAGERGKVLTNSDVKKWVPPADAETPDAAPTDSQKTDEAAAEKSKTAEAKPKAGADAEKGEEYWRGRMIAAREDLRRNEAFAEALQSRINALSAEFSAKDDPYQRAQVADDRQKAIAELDRLTTDIDKNKKAIADLEDEARRAGIPAGWIR